MEVDASRLPTAKPSRGTQETNLSPPGYAYGTVTLYGVAFQPTSASPVRETVGPTTPHTRKLIACGFSLGSPPFGRPYSGDPYWFLFLPLLRCFRWEGSRSVTRAPRVKPVVGSPIRKSPDLRLHAPPRGLSQLATSFFSARAEPSTGRLTRVQHASTDLVYADPHINYTWRSSQTQCLFTPFTREIILSSCIQTII